MKENNVGQSVNIAYKGKYYTCNEGVELHSYNDAKLLTDQYVQEMFIFGNLLFYGLFISVIVAQYKINESKK